MTATCQVTETFQSPAWEWTALAALSRRISAASKTRPSCAEDTAVIADVESAARGDGDAFARIIRRYQGILARRMMRFTRSSRDVEELVHDVFVEAYFSLSTYRGDAPLEHWLQRIATRVGYRYWKRRRGLPTVSIQDQAHDRPEVGDAAATDDAADEIAIRLDQLPPRDRLVLTLLYVESRSVAETAVLAGWSQTMVKVQAYRARKKLKKLFLESRLQTSAGKDV